MYQLHVHCTSLLNSEIILEASVTAGAATVATEIGNNCTNGHTRCTCEALGWECLPIVVDSFGVWGDKATNTISRLASTWRLAAQTRLCKGTVLSQLHGKQSCSLIRSNTRAFLARSPCCLHSDVSFLFAYRMSCIRCIC